MRRPEVHTEIEIDAPAEEVWALLSAFDRYPDWNPLVRRLLGSPEVGSTLKVRIESPNGKGPITFHSRLVAYEPGREIRWVGKLLLEWIFAGEHTLRVEPRGEDRSLFVQREDYRGVLARPAIWLFGNHVRTRFEQMNRALKDHVERMDSG